MKLEVFQPVTDWMALATILDLTVCLPLAFYIFIVRNRYSPITVLPLVIGGFWFAYFIIPPDSFGYFTPLKYGIYVVETVFIIAELFVFIMLVKKAPTVRATYRKLRAREYYFPIVLRKTMTETFGERKLASIWVTDLSIFHYGLLSWRKKVTAIPNVTSFSFHKNTSYFGVFLMLVHAMLIEVIAVHALIMQMSTLAAWIVTALDLYLLFCIIADYHAIRLSPIIIDTKKMTVQLGIRSSLEVDLDNIVSIEHVTKKVERTKDSFFVTLPDFGDEPPQFELLLKEQVPVHSVFGLKRQVSKIYVTVDDKHRFYQTIESIIDDK